jgi:hypothetical protein
MTLQNRNDACDATAQQPQSPMHGLQIHVDACQTRVGRVEVLALKTGDTGSYVLYRREKRMSLFNDSAQRLQQSRSL